MREAIIKRLNDMYPSKKYGDATFYFFKDVGSKYITGIIANGYVIVSISVVLGSIIRLVSFSENGTIAAFETDVSNVIIVPKVDERFKKGEVIKGGDKENFFPFIYAFDNQKFEEYVGNMLKVYGFVSMKDIPNVLEPFADGPVLKPTYTRDFNIDGGHFFMPILMKFD